MGLATNLTKSSTKSSLPAPWIFADVIPGKLTVGLGEPPLGAAAEATSEVPRAPRGARVFFSDRRPILPAEHSRPGPPRATLFATPARPITALPGWRRCANVAD